MKSLLLQFPLSFLVVASFLLVIPYAAYAAPQKACLKEDGSVVIKRRCKAKKGEQEISAETLQGLGATQVGPAGPAGPKGSKGEKGNSGDNGATGDTGPATPSIIKVAYTTNLYGTTLPVSGSMRVLSLENDTPTVIVGDGPLQIGVPGRLLVQGFVTLENFNSTSFAWCDVILVLASGGSTPTDGVTGTVTLAAGTTVRYPLSAHRVITQDNLDSFGTEYNVEVRCTGSGYRLPQGGQIVASYYPEE